MPDLLDLSGASIDWLGLTMVGDAADGPCVLTSIDGWEELPGARVSGRPRPTSHGSFPGPVLAEERHVLAGGYCGTPQQRDELLRLMQQAMVFSRTGFGLSDLTVTLAGRTLTAQAQLERFRPVIADNWAAGYFPWAAEWVCPDPLRYGAPVTVSTGLPQDTAGLRFSAFTDGAGTSLDYLDFGPLGGTGRVQVSNPGTAEARSLLSVTGTMPLGVELVEIGSGRRLRYEAGVTASSVVTLDSATGRVRLDTADRGGSLTRAEWWGVPPGGAVEVLFTSLSGYTADALLSVTTRPTYW